MEERRIIIHSEYLNMDFEVEGFIAVSDRGREVTMIYPTALKRLVHKLIPADVGVRYDYADVKQTMEHCVARCIITDAKGRRVQEVGEATAQSMKSDIELSHPATTAYQRAFDRAVIQYLQLPDYTYSCSEHIKLKKEDPTTIIDLRDPTEEPVGNVSNEGETTAAIAPVQQPTAVSDSAPVQQPTGKSANISATVTEEKKPASVTRNTAPTQNKQATAPNQQAAPVAPVTQPAASTASAEDLGSVMCNIGKYRSEPKTLEWVWENDNSWAIWLCDTCKANTAATKALKEKCLAYRKQRTGG